MFRSAHWGCSKRYIDIFSDRTFFSGGRREIFYHSIFVKYSRFISSTNDRDNKRSPYEGNRTRSCRERERRGGQGGGRRREMSESRKKDGRAGRKRLVDRGKRRRMRGSGAKRTSAIFSPTHHDTTRIFLALCVHVCTQMDGAYIRLRTYFTRLGDSTIYFTIGCV